MGVDHSYRYVKIPEAPYQKVPLITRWGYRNVYNSGNNQVNFIIPKDPTEAPVSAGGSNQSKPVTADGITVTMNVYASPKGTKISTTVAGTAYPYGSGFNAVHLDAGGSKTLSSTNVYAGYFIADEDLNTI